MAAVLVPTTRQFKRVRISFQTTTQNSKEVVAHITHLSLAFNHAKHESMAKAVKLQEKVSEVIFHKV